MVIAVGLALLLQATGPAPALTAVETRRIAAPEADQGVAADAASVYAVDNNTIARYALATGERTAVWQGDPALFPHINSCARVDADLVCAASNYSATPMSSSVEVFDAATLTYRRTVSLGPDMGGSLTVLDRHDGSWWAVFANYDDRGGNPGHDHRWTVLMRLDENFQRQEAWLFPQTVLDRIAPMSVSGAAWNPDGLLYVSGHDRPEVYVMALPQGGSTLRHVATVAMPTEGQAIDWDAGDSRLLWSIQRDDTGGRIVASRVPTIPVMP
ncbi:hypothetical protein [Brevundimonas sp.]|uniref:hypothetical protein n=1 Tax=Brevundimonas sp. TaxID=1871086 RepID=UPI002612DD52|nr:hypothetical protein [Brevundimonas sp.]